MTESLLERFADPAPKVRLAALLEAGRLDTVDGNAAIIDGIVRRLDDDHPGIRQAAIDMLSKLTTSLGLKVKPSVVSRIIALTRDETEGVRSEAVSALAVVGEEHQVAGRIEAVRACLSDSAVRVQASAIAAAGDLKDTESAETIAAALTGGDRDVRFEAAFALASLGDERALGVLTEALGKTKLRLDACEALRRLGSEEAKPALQSLLQKWMLPWVDKLAAQATLHALGESGGGDYVVSRLSAKNPRERVYAIALVGSHKIEAGRQSLETFAANPKDRLRASAIDALAELGNPASIAPLSALLADDSVHEEVTAALKLLKER